MKTYLIAVQAGQSVEKFEISGEKVGERVEANGDKVFYADNRTLKVNPNALVFSLLVTDEKS